MLRAVALWVALSLTAGQHVGLLCKAWCEPQAAAASGCHGEPSTAATSVTGGSCDHAEFNVGVFLSKTGPRATATADAAPVILSAGYIARLTTSLQPWQQAERRWSLEKRHLTTALRI